MKPGMVVGDAPKNDAAEDVLVLTECLEQFAIPIGLQVQDFLREILTVITSVIPRINAHIELGDEIVEASSANFRIEAMMESTDGP